MILTELLNSFVKPPARQLVVEAVAAIIDDASIEVVPQTRNLFRDAFAVYRKHSDKNWSLTDCASFVIMKRAMGESW
jgi:predicted nucleic acid-binding protein